MESLPGYDNWKTEPDDDWPEYDPFWDAEDEGD